MKDSTRRLMRGLRFQRKSHPTRAERATHLLEMKAALPWRRFLGALYAIVTPQFADWQTSQGRNEFTDPYPRGLELFYYGETGSPHGHGGPYLTLRAARNAARRLIAGSPTLAVVHIVDRANPNPPGIYGRLIERVTAEGIETAVNGKLIREN